MSNEHHHTSSLMAELVEMATATKRLPDLERELREAYAALDERNKRIEFLQGKIEQEVAINTDLASKLHAAEVARDDAGFRQLEAEDRVTVLGSTAQALLSDLGKALGAVRGDGKDLIQRISIAEREEFREFQRAKEAAAAKQAEESVDPTPASGIFEQPSYAPSASVDLPTTAASTEGQRATDPTGESLEATPSPSAEPSPSSPVSYGGVSVPSDPTASQQISPSETAQGTTASAPVGAPTHGKYANRRYADWPYYVSEAGWIEGGGTHDSYWEGRAAWANPKTA